MHSQQASRCTGCSLGSQVHNNTLKSRFDQAEKDGKLLQAAQEEQTGSGRVRELLEQGADVSCTDNFGRTPLHWASCDFPHHDRVKLFILVGADVELKDDDGKTALHLAACASDFQCGLIVRTLINAGADVHSMDKKGRTPLSYADLDERIFALLIKAGANVDHRDNDGKTPLHRCIMGVSAGLLLDAGADINARDNRGLTPLGECSGYRHAFFDPEKMKLLEERGARL